MKEELELVQNIYSILTEFVVTYSFQILGAIIILIIGFKVASFASKAIVKLGEKKELDVTLTRFMASVARVLILIFVFIIAVGKFGISIAPFIAALGAVAFGSSFALQGPLSNYGAGISIILSRPFVVGNTITVKGVNGVVEEIRLAATVLSTEDGEEITIPNKHIVGEILQNSFANKLAETTIGISYTDTPQDAVSAIKEALFNIPDICQDPPPQIGIEEFADSSINIGIRYWVPTKKYFQTHYQANHAIHQAVMDKGLTIPFPQRDIHMVRDSTGAGVTET